MADLLATAKKSNRTGNKVRRKSAGVAFADAAHRVSGAAMMPLSAANANVIAPTTHKLAKSETVVKTRAVLTVAANRVGEAVDKENIVRAANTNLVGPVAKQIGKSETVQTTKKAIGPAAKCMADAAMMPLSAANENVIAPLAKTDTVKRTRKVFKKTAGQVGEAFDKEHINECVDKIVPVAKKGAQTAMEHINAAQTMLVQALSYDEQEECIPRTSRHAAAAKEAPIATTHMVSYALASCEMRKMLLREEISEKKRAAMMKHQGKRDSSSRDDGEAAAGDMVDDRSSSRKKARKAIVAVNNPTEATDVFLPRVIESAPAAGLYEAPPPVLACRQRSTSDFSELTFGTAGGGGRAAVAEPNNFPLVVARSVDEGVDESNSGLWEC